MLTFGIITDGRSQENVERMIASIEDQHIDAYEILIVGNANIVRPHVEVLSFDEGQTPKGWITRKKNLVTENAKYDNIVYAHDYVYFPDGWFEGWEKFNDTTKWDVSINRVYTMEGPRHVDWAVCPYDMWELVPESKDTWDVALPYGTVGATDIQYISGGYFLGKKAFMTLHPLDETLLWGDAEDVEWSRRVRNATIFQFNRHSYVQLMKPNKWKPGIIRPDYLQRMAAARNLKTYIQT